MRTCKVYAKGYTSVLLILNMKHFIRDDEARRDFETLRGTDEFANHIRRNWVPELDKHPWFVRNDDYRASVGAAPAVMSPEEIGFATGVFRTLMLNRFAFPVYRLDKSKIAFDDDLESNLQFKNLFKKTWNRWDICLRPTMTGFFVLRLTMRYDGKQPPRSFLELAKDVVRLQEPFDIPSAKRWLQYKREKGVTAETEKAERSIRALLNWLGVDENDSLDVSPRGFYYPVQWKLALEVGNYLVAHSNLTLPLKMDVRLEKTPQRVFSLAHDSYVVYHFNRILTEAAVIQGRQAKNPAAQMVVNMRHISDSKVLRNALSNLIEGSILREIRDNADVLDEKTPPPVESFPSPRWRRADRLLESNLASWSDELCILTGRTAVFMPARKWRDQEIAVSTIPGSTLKVQYNQYWLGLRHLVEFVLEIRVLAQLVESESYHLLEDIAATIEKIRQGMFRGDIEFDGTLKALLARAAHLRRIVALAQSISHAPMWSRAEYAVAKAEHLMRELDVPQIFEHIQRNVESINSVADHVDELYLADLSEKNNDKTTLLSLGLAAASGLLTFLALPSFWKDWHDFVRDVGLERFAAIYFGLGTVLGFSFVAVAAYLLYLAWQQRKEISQMLDHLFNGKMKVKE